MWAAGTFNSSGCTGAAAWEAQKTCAPKDADATCSCIIDLAIDADIARSKRVRLATAELEEDMMGDVRAYQKLGK